MLNDCRRARFLLLGAVAALFSLCTPGNFIKPNPPPSLSARNSSLPETVSSDSGVIDFGDAFDSSAVPQECCEPEAGGADTFVVPVKRVRVAVIRNINRGTVYSASDVSLRAAPAKGQITIRGRILFEALSGKVRVTTASGKQEVVLPCTLAAESGYAFLDVENVSYRGALIIIPGTRGTISFVNMLDVEEYLRGVLPLEMGPRSMEEIEALKAQAVAARTYTYRRIVERGMEPYDMVSTVADQVYGGASVENRESDYAVKATRDRILTYGDSIIYAYYHSTCGGMTATIDEVWKKQHQPYLVSVADTNSHGEVYCAASTYFKWSEEWPWPSFALIVPEQIKKMYPQQQISGPLSKVTIDELLPCGRVKTAAINGKGWKWQLHGDEIRFALRRPVGGNPILRSARFTLNNSGRSVVRASGSGYGHGVGMCQMGALGRAHEGQLYHSILNAYYTGATLATVKEEKP